MRFVQQALWIVLQAVDWVTTFVGVHHGGQEMNPFALYLIAQIGFVPALTLVKVLAVPLVYLPVRILRVLNIVFVVCMTWNVWRMIVHLRGG